MPAPNPLLKEARGGGAGGSGKIGAIRCILELFVVKV